MQYIEGRNVRELVERAPAGIAKRSPSLFGDRSLTVAHARGVMHRIKAGNIMVTSGGVKVLDFGLAKLRRECRTHLLEFITGTDRAGRACTAVGHYALRNKLAE
jgi:tRNA A-37 threonylcarbamoyl transferase component Bud32